VRQELLDRDLQVVTGELTAVQTIMAEVAAAPAVLGPVELLE
jgi:hypothetical protein